MKDWWDLIWSDHRELVLIRRDLILIAVVIALAFTLGRFLPEGPPDSRVQDGYAQHCIPGTGECYEVYVGD